MILSANRTRNRSRARSRPQARSPTEDGFFSTGPLSFDLKIKTLEAWVKLDSLTQRGAGVITVQTPDGNEFDAIVFGEREPGRWMAGSNGFVRTSSFGGPEETEAANEFVHVAITYAADGTITGYRNGKPYGKAYSRRVPCVRGGEDPGRSSAAGTSRRAGTRCSPVS